MPTVGGIVVPTGGAPASGRRTFLDIMTTLARPVDASDPTVLALAADAFRAAVRRMNRKGSWPWEYQEEDISVTQNQRHSTVSGVIKKPMAMHYLTASGGVENRHLHYQAYDVFSERFTMDVTGQPYVYTIPNLFETGQIRWWPTPSANYDMRFAYWRVTPAPKREQDPVEIPEYLTDVYEVIAWHEFMTRLPSEQRPMSINQASVKADQAFRELSAHVNDPGDRSRHMNPIGGPN